MRRPNFWGADDRRRASAGDRVGVAVGAAAAVPEPGGIMRGEDDGRRGPVRTNAFRQLVCCLRVRGERRHDELGQEDRTAVAKDAAAAATNVCMEVDVLDCPICFEPLRPPVFQCAVGHLICSSCHSKLPKRKKCHHCSRKSSVYERSYGVERVLGSIQVPCSNAEFGCAVKTSYYDKAGHAETCPHAPCSCPETGCGFTGSTGMLLAHFTAVHRWPSTRFSYALPFSVDVLPVQEAAAAHVVVVLLSGEDDDDAGRLFLLDVVPAGPLGCFVSVFCVRPRADETRFRCHVSLNYSENTSFHMQSSEFLVPSTTLADGMPRDCSMSVLVPRFYLEKHSKISVTMNKAFA